MTGARYISYFFAFCTLFAISCDKNYPNVPTPIAIDSNLAKYYNYKPGTYWIYKDSISGRVDSFATISNSSGAANGGNTQSIFVNAYMNYISIVVNDYNTNSPNIVNAQWKWTLLEKAANLEMPGFYSALFLYPMTKGDVESYFNYNNVLDEYFVPNIFPTAMINGNNYSNVALINHYDTLKSSPSQFIDRYYINDSIGIIKMKLFHPLDSVNFIWELQRCSIVR